jgi:hypothetical protein
MGASLQAFTDAEQAWAYMADHDALNRHLRSLDPTRQQDVISSLECFEDQFAPEHVVPGIIVLLNLSPELPQRQRGMFELDTHMVVSRVTFRLLRSLNDPDAAEAVVKEILPNLTTLSSKMYLIHQIGYREGLGHKLVSEKAATLFETAWCDEVISAPVQALIEDPELLRVLLYAQQMADPSQPTLVIDECPEMTLALLRSSRSESLTQGMGSRAIKRTPQLAWKSLVNLFGDEARNGGSRQAD